MRVYDSRMASMRERDKRALRAKPDVLIRFWDKVKKTGTCWLWTGNIAPTGYACFYYIKGDKIGAHRFSLLLSSGLSKAKGPFYANHKCYNKHCVRPSHLYWGTPKQNIRDAWDDPRRLTEEFRMRKLYKEKISNDIVREWWNRYWFESATQQDLASEQDCSPEYVAGVVNGRYRKHITKHLPRPKGGRKSRVTVVNERNARAMFTNEQVQAMRRILCAGGRELDVAALLQVDRGPITSIAIGRTWKNLVWPAKCKPRKQAAGVLRAEPAPVRDPKSKRLRTELSASEIRDIYNDYWYRNANQRVLAVKYGTNSCAVNFIVHKKFGADVTADLKPNPDRKRLAPFRPKVGQGNCRLSVEQVQEIRRYIDAGTADKVIAQKYTNLTADMVMNIRLKKTWNGVPWPASEP